MYYVYDWRINKVLQAEEYQQEAGQEVLIIDKENGMHMYTTKELLGDTPREACAKATEYIARQIDSCRYTISKAQEQETKLLGFLRNAMKAQSNT